MTISVIEVFFRLLVSLILSGVIGFERESHGRPAGFRTHILVSLGSTLIMIVSAYGFTHAFGPESGVDPSRLAAQVISGIGFLGAGTIIHEGASIRGLTTAASLWAVAGIGLAIGIGMYYPAIITTVFVVLTLIVLNQIEFSLLSDQHNIVTVRTVDEPGQLPNVFNVLAKFGVTVTNVEISVAEQDNIEVIIKVKRMNKKYYVGLLDELLNQAGITLASID